MKTVNLVVLAVLLSACTQNNNLASDITKVANNKPINTESAKPITAKDIVKPKNKVATPDEIARCQQQGGSISKQGLFEYDFCVVEFADKDKFCTDGSDCQAGWCVSKTASFDDEVGKATTGVCPSNNIPFGCHGTVNQGKFGGFLCVD